MHVLPYVDDVGQVFLKTDLAICSVGSTCWKLAAVGVPFITFQTVDDQELIFEYIDDKKIGIALRKKGIVDDTLARALIDCSGSRRIAKALNEIHF